MERSELRAQEEVPKVKVTILSKSRIIAISCIPDHDIGVESTNIVLCRVKKKEIDVERRTSATIHSVCVHSACEINLSLLKKVCLHTKPLSSLVGV